MAEYFLKKDPNIIDEVRNSIYAASIILWKAPESWSAWQWVMIIFSIKFGGIPLFLKAFEENGGGSIMIPLLFIHRMKPLVQPPASNPWEEPKNVIPK